MKLLLNRWQSSTQAILKSIMSVSATCMLAVSVSGCNGGTYSQPWYDVYGYYCGSGSPGPGCNFWSDGYKIVAGEDPYYSSSSLSYGFWSFYDSYGYYQAFTGWAWQSPTGIIYDSWGNALNNDEDKDSKDLIGDVAAQEQAVVETVGRNFAQKYALTEVKGIAIAKNLNDWANLSKKEKRARTDQDVADFSIRLYNIPVDKAKSAIERSKAGDPSGLEAVNNEVAEFWGTSPETSKVILKKWYKNNLSEVGIK